MKNDKRTLESEVAKAVSARCHHNNCRGYLVRGINRGVTLDRCQFCLDAWLPNGIKITPELAASQLRS